VHTRLNKKNDNGLIMREDGTAKVCSQQVVGGGRQSHGVATDESYTAVLLNFAAAQRNRATPSADPPRHTCRIFKVDGGRAGGTCWPP